MSVPGQSEPAGAQPPPRPESPAPAASRARAATGRHGLSATQRARVATKSGPSNLKLLVYAAFFLMVAVLVGLIVVGMKMIVGASEPPPKPAEVIPEDPDYLKNPYLAAQANFFTALPEGDTVLMFDASMAMNDLIWQVVEGAKTAIRQMGGAHATAIVAWHEDGPKQFPEKLTSAGGIDRAQLGGFLDQTAEGVGGGLAAEAAFMKAVDLAPRKIICVARQAPLSDDWKKITDALKGKGIKVDVVMIGPPSEPLKKLAADTGGSYRETSPGQVGSWYQAYLNENPLSPSTPAPSPAPDQTDEKKQDDATEPDKPAS